MRLRYKVILFVVLLALPVAARLGWYYRGVYKAPTISEVDASKVGAELPTYQRYEDEPIAGDGHVVIDLSHGNRLNLNDMDPLRDRLFARGVAVEAYDGEDGSLGEVLKNASALVVIAPAEEFADEAEVKAIKEFVADGGRLLLAADPTRPAQDSGIDYEEYVYIPRISGVPAANSLANVFDISFFAEHVYNIQENEGNFRNVRFTRFAEADPLTEGLGEVVFFAAHSMRSNGTSLIVGDENTLSPVRMGEKELAVATTTEDGRVLAIGDVTFMTVPYHTVADNDLLLSNIADWLAVDGRDRSELDDFPHLYSQPVDLVQASGNLLDPRLIAYGDELQTLFGDAGLPLELALLTSNPYSAFADKSPAVEESEDGQAAEAATENEAEVEFPDLLASGHDVLLVGTFDELDITVQRYLSQTVGISLTMVVTDSAQMAPAAEEGEAPVEEEAAEPAAEEPGGEEVPVTEEETTERFSGLTPAKEGLASGREGLAAFQDDEPVQQGEIGLNETVEGELAEAEAHSWTFSSGPATIDIEVTTDEELDAVVMVLDPDEELLSFEDSGLSGDGEQLLGVEIPDDGVYSIIVFDWLGSAGSYTLSVTESSGAAVEPISAVEEPVEESPEEPAVTNVLVEGAPAGTIEIEDVGTFAIEGLTLFVIDRRSDRLVIMALAESGDMVLNALERLVAGDFADCVMSAQVVVCSTGEAPESYGLDATLGSDVGLPPPEEE